MIFQAHQVAHRFFGFTGYGGAATYAGLTLADVDLILRIAVGLVSLVSVSVHLYFKIRNERAKK